MGLVADMLRDGYEEVPKIEADFAELFTGSIEELRQQAISSLDIVNAYAQGIYGFIPDNDQPLDEQYRGRIRLSIKQARETVESINHAAAVIAVSYTEEMADVVLSAGQQIVETIKELPKNLSKGILVSIWPLLILGGIVLVVMWRLRKEAVNG